MIHLLLQALTWLIIGDAVLSWIQPPSQLPRKFTYQLTMVLYAPLHKVLPPEKTGGLDLSPLVWLFGIQFLMRYL